MQKRLGFRAAWTMTDCKYCGQACTDAQDLADFNIHRRCDGEWARRIDADLCTLCGNKFSADSLDYCRDCDGKWEYRGYPGP